MKYFIAFLILAYSCAPNTNDIADQRAEVMKVHDDAMIKMGEIRKYISELEDKNEISASKQISDLIEELEAADEGMMVWMQKYKEPEDEEQLESFYKKEKNKITQVADAIYKSLENAKNYFKE